MFEDYLACVGGWAGLSAVVFLLGFPIGWMAWQTTLNYMNRFNRPLTPIVSVEWASDSSDSTATRLEHDADSRRHEKVLV